MNETLKLIQDEFDNTLATDPFFRKKDTNTLVGTIYKALLQKRQELCTSIFDPISDFIKTLPYPLTPDQTEAMRELRKGIRQLTKTSELVFRMTDHACGRILNDVKE